MHSNDRLDPAGNSRQSHEMRESPAQQQQPAPSTPAAPSGDQQQQTKSSDPDANRMHQDGGCL